MEKSISLSPQQTQKIAQNLAQVLIGEGPGKQASVVALQGELGAGKTTFAQGFAKALGVKGRVLSPTFLIVKPYDLAKKLSFSRLYHIDCYRVKSPKELIALGAREILKGPGNIVLIEWADKVSPTIPKEATWVLFTHLNNKGRSITMGRSNKVK